MCECEYVCLSVYLCPCSQPSPPETGSCHVTQAVLDFVILLPQPSECLSNSTCHCPCGALVSLPGILGGIKPLIPLENLLPSRLFLEARHEEDTQAGVPPLKTLPTHLQPYRTLSAPSHTTEHQGPGPRGHSPRSLTTGRPSLLDLLVRFFHARAIRSLSAVEGLDGECVVFLQLTVQFLLRAD